MYSFEGALPPGGQSKRCFWYLLLLAKKDGLQGRSFSGKVIETKNSIERKEQRFLEVQRVLQLRIHRWPLRKKNSAFAVMFIQEEIHPRKEQEEEEDSVIMYRFSIHCATR